MPRPKLGNVPISLRLTPAVDAVLVAIARGANVRAINSDHDPIGTVAVEAFGRFLEREGLIVERPVPLEINWSEHEELAREAVLSLGTEPKSITRSFVVPASMIEALDTLRSTVDAWPRYQTKIKWNSHVGEYQLVRRNTPPPKLLVQWAAIVEWLDARGSARRYARTKKARPCQTAA